MFFSCPNAWRFVAHFAVPSLAAIDFCLKHNWTDFPNTVTLALLARTPHLPLALWLATIFTVYGGASLMALLTEQEIEKN